MKAHEKIFGLTGGIGCGKSTVLNLLKKMPGIITCETDQLAKDIVLDDKNTELIESLLGTTLPANKVERAAHIASIIFSSSEKRLSLQSFVHPLVWQKTIELRASIHPEAILVSESALIYESNVSKLFYRVIVVTCSHDERIRRLVKHRGIQPSDIEARIALQLPLEEKVRRADFIIDTTGPENGLEKSVAHLFHYLTTR